MNAKRFPVYGHFVVETTKGLVYEDDGSICSKDSVRPCKLCKAKVESGGHDPCIANLPGVTYACCGHGLDTASGYVAFDDGRCMRFSGLTGGTKIREVVDDILNGKDAPNGFVFDDDTMWWAGLSDFQRDYVDQNIPRGITGLILKSGAKPSEAYLNDQAFWADGLSDEQVDFVWNNMGNMLDELVLEAKQLQV